MIIFKLGSLSTGTSNLAKEEEIVKRRTCLQGDHQLRRQGVSEKERQSEVAEGFWIVTVAAVRRFTLVYPCLAIDYVTRRSAFIRMSYR